MQSKIIRVTRQIVRTTPKQTEFFKAVKSGLYTRLLFGGGVGGGKTIGSLLTLYLLCKIYPGSRWGVVRKDLPTLKRTTIPSFWKSCPMPFFHEDRFNKSEMVATAENGSRIEFISEAFTEDPELHRFDGYEMNGFLLEEANELQFETYLKCIERSARWVIDPMPLPYILITCNPHQGYLKDIFYTPWSKGVLKPPYYFVRSLVTDNPHHSPNYIKNLKEIKKRSPMLYRRLVDGSWDAEDNAQQLVSWEALYNVQDKIMFPEDTTDDMFHMSLGIDVGRYGPDPSVWTVLKGTHDVGCNIQKILRVQKTSIPQVIKISKNLINEFDIPHDRVWLDVVGLGGGAYDGLVEEGYDIKQVVGGSTKDIVEQAVDTGYKFKNVNAQMGWNMKLGIEDYRVGNLVDDELRADIAAQGYDIVGDRAIQLWGKDDIKKKLRRSTDKGDSFRYGYWGQIYDIIEPLPSFTIM